MADVVGSVLVTVVDGLVLAIALDDEAAIDDEDSKDSAVAEGTSEEEVAIGALVAILVLLEDIVNCLTTNFLGFLCGAMLVTISILFTHLHLGKMGIGIDIIITSASPSLLLIDITNNCCSVEYYDA